MAECKCSICGETFDNGDELADHIRQSHGGANEESYECSICGERFESDADPYSTHERGTRKLGHIDLKRKNSAIESLGWCYKQLEWGLVVLEISY